MGTPKFMAYQNPVLEKCSVTLPNKFAIDFSPGTQPDI